MQANGPHLRTLAVVSKVIALDLSVGSETDL